MIALLLAANAAEGTPVNDTSTPEVFKETITFSDGSKETIEGTEAQIVAAADKRQTSIFMEADKEVDELSPEGMRLLEEREGHHDFAEHLTYTDGDGKVVREGFLTAGHGHRVVEGDINPATGKPWQEGDAVDAEWSRDQLAIDSAKAFDAAKTQARSVSDKSLAGDQPFIDALTSVNYQLGTNWRKEFPKAWKDIHQGNYNEAADEIARGSKSGTLSRWSVQTPTRVEDFQNALRDLEE